MPSTTVTVPTSFAGDVPVLVEERGAGRPVVILHGGGGPASVAAFTGLLAESLGRRVLAPVHPGFGGTERPEALHRIDGLAELYAGLFDVLGLDDVAVIGNSIGGWVAAELALRDPARLGRLVLVDAVGAVVPDHPGIDFDALPPARITEYSWYDPSRAPVLDPSAMPAAARDVLIGNRAALAAYGGTSADPALLERLADIRKPTLVVWGEADRIVDPDYGRAYAAAIPGAKFVLLPHTGHVPQMETPDALLAALDEFLTA